MKAPGFDISGRVCPFLLAAVVFSASGDVRAQATRPGPTSAAAELTAGLRSAKTEGIPLVVVVTSTGDPRSRAFHRALSEGEWAGRNRGGVRLMEFVAEADPNLVERLQVKSVPTILVYASGGSPDGGVLCRGVKASSNVDETAAWLATLGVGESARSTALVSDPSVVRTGGDHYPSSQQQQPSYGAPPPPPQAPPAAPPMVYGAPPPAMSPPLVPLYAAAPPQPQAAYVQIPGPDVVVRQGEPRVFMAPPAGQPAYGAAPPPTNLYMAPAPAPTHYAAAPPVYQAPPQPVVYGAPPPQPYAAPAPAPVVYGAAPPQPYAAVTNQTTALSTAGSRTRVRVRGPGPVRSMLANLGERMTQLGRSRIETIQETDLNTPAVQNSGGLATFSTTTAAPMPAPQIGVGYVPQNPPPPPPTYSAPPQPPVTASPQETASGHGHLFKKAR